MRSDSSNGSRAASAQGFMALFPMLAVGLVLSASPAEAAPFAYVTNDGAIFGPDTVTVIDTPRPWWPRSRWGMSPRGSP
jgi:hypothetical protein